MSLTAKRKEAHEKLCDLAKKAQDFHTEHEADWGDDHEKQWGQMNDDLDALEKEINACDEKLAAQLKRHARLNQLDDMTTRLGLKSGTTVNAGRSSLVSDFSDSDDPLKGFDDQQIGNMALSAWVKSQCLNGAPTREELEAARVCGINPNAKQFKISLTSTDVMQEIRDLQHVGIRSKAERREKIKNVIATTTGGAGATAGTLFGIDFVAELEQAMLWYGGMMGVADIHRTATGEPYQFPTANDTGNTGRQIGEGTAVAQVDPTFANQVLGAFKFTSDEILVNQEILEDNAVMLVSVLGGMLGTRLGRIMNTRFTTGTGGGVQPAGIVPSANVGVTAAAAAALVWDEVIDLEYTIDLSRRDMNSVGYMCHDDTVRVLRKLKNGDGNYLWQAATALQTGTGQSIPALLNNHPYTRNNDMPQVGTGNRSLLFGQFDCYKVRMVRDSRFYRLQERHRENDQDAFLAFVRGDGFLLNAGDNPVSCLVHP